MLYTPQKMHSDLRDWIDESREAFWSDDNLMLKLHNAQQRIIRDIAEESPSQFHATYDFALVADQSEYEPPLNARNGTRWIFAENRSAGKPFFYIVDVDLRRVLFTDAENIPWETNGTKHLTMSGGKIRISPAPTSAADPAIRFGYIPSHGNMVQRKVASTTSTTVALSTASPDYITQFGQVDNRDDYYNGMEWYVVSGPGRGQFGKITDYVGLTATLTQENAPTVSLTTSSVIATVCPVPEDFRDVVVLTAAADGVVKGKSRLGEIMLSLYGNPSQPGTGKYSEMKSWFAQRQDFRPRSVTPFGGEF